MQWGRRLCQAVFLLLFVWLVLVTRLYDEGEAPPLLSVFFELNPLIALVKWISARTIATGLLLALLTIVGTLILGRVFCGWVCPFGAFHHLVAWFRKRPEASALPEDRSIWQRGKYLVLVVLLVMAVFGVHWIGILDPLALFYRSLAVVAYPAAQYAVDDASTSIFQADPSIGSFEITSVSEPAYRFMRDRVFRVGRQAFVGGATIGLIFLGLAGLNFVKPRFWCRYVCPLGGLLGLVSIRPSLRLVRDEDTCNECGRCGRACPAAAQPHKHGEWLPTECYVCWNCVAACNFKGLSFAFESPLSRPKVGSLDLSRRAVIAAGIGGFAGLFAFRLTPHAQGQIYPPDLVRPPGSRPEREFLQRCIQCGVCMRGCPTNALHPAGFFEAGIEGLWTPMVVAKRGYCQHTCNQCGIICPTGAIQPLSLEEKQSTSIGLAFFDTTRCLPYAFNRECIICEEHCPVTPKAITFVTREIEIGDGQTQMIRQPQVDPDQCIGCGICEWSCVFSDRAAIRITSAGESRHSRNQPILPSFGPY